jgi:hypothetical protein
MKNYSRINPAIIIHYSISNEQHSQKLFCLLMPDYHSVFMNPVLFQKVKKAENDSN